MLRKNRDLLASGAFSGVFIWIIGLQNVYIREAFDSRITQPHSTIHNEYFISDIFQI